MFSKRLCRRLAIANSAAKIPNDRICPTLEMILCPPIVTAKAPMKKQELIAPMAISFMPESFSITPIELTIKELPTKRKDMPMKRAFMDFMVRVGLVIGGFLEGERSFEGD